MVFTHCKKEDLTEKPLGPNRLKSSLTVYDSAGVIHNQLLSYFASQNLTTDTTMAAYIDAVNEFIENTYSISGIGDSLEQITDIESSLERFRNYDDLEGYNQEISDLCNNLGLSSALETKMLAIGASAFENSSCINCYIDDLQSSFNHQVDSITSNLTELSSTEKSSILYSASIAKASFGYWSNQFKNSTNSYGIEKFEEPSDIKFQVPLWVTADAAGALTGLSIGAAAFGLVGIGACAAISSAMNYR